MKVKLKYGQLAYQGAIDDLIYYWHPIAKRLIARRRPTQRRLGASNERIGNVAKNLKSLDPSPEYRDNLRMYLAMIRGTDKIERSMNWAGLFTRVMWSMQRQNPELDIATLSRDDIYTLDLPVISVRRAVEAGLLAPVPGVEMLTALI